MVAGTNTYPYLGAGSGGGGSTPSAGTTGNPVPASADQLGLNVGGILEAWTGVNPVGTTFAGQVDLTSVGGTTVALGQTVAANSIPVVIASNQTAIPVTGSFSATNPAVGTTGTTVPASSNFIGLNVAGNLQGWAGVAAANATAFSGRIDLSSLNGTALAIGQQAMSASIPVVLASNQSNVTTVIGAALPAGTNAIGTVSALQVGTWTVNFAGAGIALRGATSAISTAAVVLIAAQNVTTKIYVTGLQFGNTSGTTVVVQLNDTALSNFIVPSGGGSNPGSFLVPLVLATANSSLTFSVLSTAVAAIYVNAQGYGAA